MSYTVIFKSPSSVPADLLNRVRLLLDEIGETCATVPRDDQFWTYMKESGLTLEFAGWRFSYRLDRSRRELVVYAVDELESASKSG